MRRFVSQRYGAVWIGSEPSDRFGGIVPWVESEQDRSLFVVLSVLVPDFAHLLGPDEFFLGPDEYLNMSREAFYLLIEETLAAGILRDTGRRVDTIVCETWRRIPIWKLV